MIGYQPGYRIGSWLVDRVPERAIAWLARQPRVQAWAQKDGRP